MIEVDSLEKIQARNGILLEEMREEAQRFIELLGLWKLTNNEEYRAELESQVITLRIHTQALEKSLEDESEAMPEDEEKRRVKPNNPTRGVEQTSRRWSYLEGSD